MKVLHPFYMKTKELFTAVRDGDIKCGAEKCSKEVVSKISDASIERRGFKTQWKVQSPQNIINSLYIESSKRLEVNDDLPVEDKEKYTIFKEIEGLRKNLFKVLV